MSYVASYRIQLRAGMDFDAVADRLDHLAGLGVSHVYLSPILTAAPGSTHGYDVTDPTRIDPELGGAEGFERLARGAGERGLSLIVDIVPNHMAFALETPWLFDVLRHGRDSRHADVFDIDWEAPSLLLPWLERPLQRYLEAGEVALRDDEAGGSLQVGGLAVPLAPGSAAGLDGPLTAEALSALHEAQAWRLVSWELERDSITHRRFFTVTGLIGVRVEIPEVFEATHRAIFDLADRGLIGGLRIDHIDGLSDPDAYLRALSARLPKTDIWVEKILVPGEALRDWPVSGTTGYEAAATITRMLTDAGGFRALDDLWRRECAIDEAFDDVVTDAKHEMLTQEFAAELRQLGGIARACAAAQGEEFGPESLREALTEVLAAFPRYRSYIAQRADAEDAAIWARVADAAAEQVRSRAAIDWLVATILRPDTAGARALAWRLQQVTGALLAKSHEDTAGFRFNRYLAANEVGAEPSLATIEAGEVAAALETRRRRWPGALTLGSSHDTKRSEDARARLIAMTHAPDAATTLWEASKALPGSGALDANRRWYALQAALAIWGEPEAAGRLADHLVKALREAKEITYWTNPDAAREAALVRWSGALMASWDGVAPAPLTRLARIADALSLREAALRCLFPGMPDIYQGGEGMLRQLTDPDNRRTPDWQGLAALRDAPGPAGRKNRLLRRLLALRREDPRLFAEGEALWQPGFDATRLIRQLEGRTVGAVLAGPRLPPHTDWLWRAEDAEAGLSLGIFSSATR